MKMNEADMKERAAQIQSMMMTPGWVRWFVPWVEEKIRKSSDIRGIIAGTDVEMVREVHNRRTRMDVYRSVLTIGKTWMDEYEKEKGESNGKNT